MSKLLKINTLVAAAAVIASLMSCAGGDTKSNNNETSEPKATTEEPKVVKTEAVEQVVEQQESEQKDDIEDEPVSVDVVKQAYSVPSELKYYQKSDDYLFQKIYPIGWSKDGKFAYVIEPPDEASGLYYFKLVIKNMVNDKDIVVWEPDNELEEGSVKQMWKDYNMTFAELLNREKIIPQNDIKLLGTEFSSENKKYKVTIENKMETDPDFGFEVVKTTNISIKSPDLGEKNIYSYTEKEANFCLGRMVQGVIKSPYENRVAVFVRQESRGYEGPPNVITQFFVGAELELNFKQKAK